MSDKTATAPSSGASGKDTSGGGSSAKKVGLIGLVGIVISAMIGGGIYNLPQNMAQDASAGAIIIAWIVTGIGIWFIANTFRILSAARPELTNGLYAYAEKGFGKLAGFFVAYGYWICNCFALVAYSVLVMATLNYFVPDFSGGNNIPSIIGGSIITWIMYLLALRGAKQTSFLNIIGTIGKLVPVLIFILAVATIFKFSVFMEGFWGMKDHIALTLNWDNVMPQVQSTMLVTLWLFLGIEGAVVVSGKAKSQTAVRKATTIGFLVTLALYVVVSLLPLGVYTQAEIGSMANPSMAAIMLKSFGSWGEIMVNAGVIISVLSSWLVWMLMLGEMPLAASQSGIFPKPFVKENKHGAPSTSLLWTTIVIQVVLIASYFIGSNAWTTMISITSVMALPCYLFCTLFLFKIALDKKGYPSGIFASRGMALFTGAAGSLYGLWLIYAAGLNYLMIACIVYAIGIPLYIVGVRQHDKTTKLFKNYEKIVVGVVIALGIAGVVYSVLNFGHF
ncbi:MAG: basic amino acid/polyamine antiporter [Gordonibacter sp.]|uniref:basic amino acid/polyamine antiporter n=1 Tax=Gordonibacter sp. TaxID=1968902 RepID=UPI002FCACF0D